MKILHLIHSLSGGGAERQLCYLAPELAKLGHEIHIAYHKDAPPDYCLENVRLHKIKAYSNYDPMLLIRLFKLVKTIKPDIINTWIIQMDVLGGIIAHWLRFPWFIREPSNSMAYSSDLKTKLRKKLAMGLASIISNSKSGDEYWKNFIPDRNRHIIRNGIPLSQINNIIPDSKINNLPNLEKPFILSVGRLSADKTGNKNLKNLIESLALANQKTPVSAIICGSGPQLNELLLMTKKEKLENRIFFLGSVDAKSVWNLMKQAAALVSLSSFEGCPNTVLEAMACKCPLIVSDIPAHREILDEKSAIFVDPNNFDKISKAIFNVVYKSDRANLLADNANNLIKPMTITSMAKSYEKAYYLKQ
jgi:glycosyltransferase involved in cell wall biosynthesis